MENWTIENFTIVGQCMLKLAGNFWPLILAGMVIMFIEWRKEVASATR